jgi:hypothetical protein
MTFRGRHDDELSDDAGQTQQGGMNCRMMAGSIGSPMERPLYQADMCGAFRVRRGAP